MEIVLDGGVLMIVVKWEEKEGEEDDGGELLEL